MNLNNYLKIIQAFKTDKDFIDEIISDAKKNNTYNDDFQKRIDTAVEECKKYTTNLSKETVELITDNTEKYLKFIEDIKNKQANNRKTDTNEEYNKFFRELEDLNPNISFHSWIPNILTSSVPIEQIKLPNNFYNINGKISNGKNIDDGRIEFTVIVRGKNKDSSKNNSEEKNNDVKSKQNANENRQKVSASYNQNENNINYYDFNSGHVYSSTYAQKELDKIIKNTNKEYENKDKNIYSKDSKVTKKDFYDLEELNEKRNNLEEQRTSINDLTESFSNNNKITRLDNKIDFYQKKINENKEKMKKTKFVSIKKLIASRITKLQNKQINIKAQQRRIVDTAIINMYNKSSKKNHIKNRSEAIEKYYKYRQELIEAKRNDSRFEVVNKIKDKIYNIREIPLELQMKMIKRLQNVQIQFRERNGKSELFTQQMQKNNSQGKTMGAA